MKMMDHDVLRVGRSPPYCPFETCKSAKGERVSIECGSVTTCYASVPGSTSSPEGLVYYMIEPQSKRSVSARNSCYPNPCENGGTCVNWYGNFFCKCAPGYTGIVCHNGMYVCGGGGVGVRGGGGCVCVWGGGVCTCRCIGVYVRDVGYVRAARTF